tara:strand:- start:573 stop:719 length:147 start_codon:yes stop_codon:yes gene_type:complete
VIFKVTAKKNGNVVAEYLYELEETAAAFASGMKEKGYQVWVEKIASHD